MVATLIMQVVSSLPVGDSQIHASDQMASGSHCTIPCSLY